MYQNDKEAYCLANTYGFCPPMAVYPAKRRQSNAGKYEPDHNVGAETRCMVLAHFSGATNILVQYSPDDLEYS